MEHERPKVGVGILIVKGNKVLIGRRLGSHGAGTWQIPGGHLEFNGTFENTALREAEEETGLTDLTMKGLICIINNRVYDKHFVTIGMLAVLNSGEPYAAEPEKSAEWQWFDPKSLPEPMFIPSKGVIEHWLADKIYIQ